MEYGILCLCERFFKITAVHPLRYNRVNLSQTFGNIVCIDFLFSLIFEHYKVIFDDIILAIEFENIEVDVLCYSEVVILVSPPNDIKKLKTASFDIISVILSRYSHI